MKQIKPAAAIIPHQRRVIIDFQHRRIKLPFNTIHSDDASIHILRSNRIKIRKENLRLILYVVRACDKGVTRRLRQEVAGLQVIQSCDTAANAGPQVEDQRIVLPYLKPIDACRSLPAGYATVIASEEIEIPAQVDNGTVRGIFYRISSHIDYLTV